MAAFVNFVLAFLAISCATMIPGASASSFLKSRTHGDLGQATLDIIERTLLAELATDSARLTQFESELRPMYASLPKNEHGALEPAAVRYALHRHFVHKHGWYVKGLEPSGQSWNTSAPTSIMKQRVPLYIQSLFEQHMQGKGMELHGLAVFAATLSDFVHNEALSDIMDLYTALALPTTSPTSSSDVDMVMTAYVLKIIDNYTITSRRALREAERNMVEDYPNWGDFQMWVNDIRETMALDRSRRSLTVERYTLESVLEEAQTLNDRLGAFQDIECRPLKSRLAELEYNNTGRVLLSEFYREGLDGGFLFSEHDDYLRRLGALDESDPNHPSVIIPNYMVSQANCLTSTSFHSVCCIDECEGLMGHLERDIAAPAASVTRIAELVAGMQSDTVHAPRNLSDYLVSRLGEIADHHDGLVPLHGRLFAQWMHHAYPLECPFPHTAGSIAPISPDEWMEEMNVSISIASEHYRRGHIEQVEGLQPKIDTLPWIAVEELVVPRKRLVQRGSSLTHLARKVVPFLAVVFVALPISRAWKSLPSTFVKEKAYLV